MIRLSGLVRYFHPSTNHRTLALRPLALTGLIALMVASRFIPHMPNFSPLGAIALFGGAHFEKRWQGFVVPLLSVFISDLILNNVVYAGYYDTFVFFYEGFYWQYGSYAAIVLLGNRLFREVSIVRVVVGATASSVLFFVVSNFGVWAGGTLYVRDAGGLLTCYVAGLPFFKGTFSGNLLYSILLFGSFALAEQYMPALRKERHAEA